ncbi:MAG: nickel pincer cofactor biosynthesis protein LarB [Planctomyces sp.]|nr:nickel pincer cofactor biosynthesis protein LarB [Planctomyces sp.]
MSEDADLDLNRQSRCGFPEVIYGEGKPADLILRLFERQQANGQDSLVTRLSVEAAELLATHFPHGVHNAVARTFRLRAPSADSALSGQSSLENAVSAGPVYVVTAGSSDRPVAEEAMETLHWMKVDCELIQDVGVAGPHRLIRHIPRLQTAVAIVCVAGMEAALPSVVGGYVPCPVIGVPTSVGYGASFQGVTALLSMVTCCASNVVAVNIDAGFKGGYVAGLIATRAAAGQRSK